MLQVSNFNPQLIELSEKTRLDNTDWEAGLIQTAKHQIAKKQQEYNMVSTITNKLI